MALDGPEPSPFPPTFLTQQPPTRTPRPFDPATSPVPDKGDHTDSQQHPSSEPTLAPTPKLAGMSTVKTSAFKPTTSSAVSGMVPSLVNGVFQNIAPDATALLRHRLDQLDYAEYDFDPHSMPLIKRLLADVVAATDAAKKFRHQADAATSEGTVWRDQLDPLRAELAHVTAENNKLHMDIIRLSDEKEAREKRTSSIIRRYEQETADLKFLCSQFQHRIEEEQKKMEMERQKVEDALGRQGVIGVGVKQGGKLSGEKLLQKLQKIDMQTGIEPLTHPTIDFPPPDPMVSDMIKLSEARVEMLEKQVGELNERNGDLDRELSLVRDQLSSREQEIQRLGVQVEISRAQQYAGGVGAGGTVETLGFGSSAAIQDIGVAKRRIDQLEMQIEHLQEYIEGLEKEISLFEQDKQNVIAAYEDEKSALAQDLQKEKDHVDMLLKNLARVETMVQDLEKMKLHTTRKDSRYKLRLDADKKTVAKSTPSNSNLPVAKTMKQVTELNEKIKNLESRLKISSTQLKNAKNEVEKVTKENADLKKRLEQAALESNQATTPKSPKVSSSTVEIATKFEERIRILETRNSDLETTIRDLRGQLDHMESRRTDAPKPNNAGIHQSELDQLKRNLQVAERAVLQSEKVQVQLSFELEQAQGERDRLVHVLEQFEHQLNDLHTNVQVVTAERDNLAKLYEQLTDEITLLRRTHPTTSTRYAHVQTDRSASPINIQREPTTSAAYEETITELKNQVGALKSSELELKRTSGFQREEIAKLKSDLEQIVYKQHESGTSAMEALRQLETERDGQTRLKTALDAKERDRLLLQDNIASLEKHVTRLKEEIHAWERKDDNSKTKVRQLELDKDRETFQLREARSKLSEMEAKLERATHQLERTHNDNQELEDQLKKQRELLTEVDRERDEFQGQMDEKDVRLTQLQAQCTQLNETKAQLEHDVMMHQEQLDSLNHHLTETDREVTSLNRQLEMALQERDTFASEAQRNGEEARNVGSDLVAVAKENQLLHSEITEVGSERDRLRDELAECERHIQYLDDTLKAKESEKEHLMSSYRKLIADYEKLDLILKSSSEDGNQIRMQVILKDKQVEQMSRTIDELSASLNQCRIDLNAYEKQSSSKYKKQGFILDLTRALATSERTIKHLEASLLSDKARLSREVTVARDVSVTIERSKDDTQKQLTALAVENERLVHSLHKCEHDRDMLMSQHKTEMAKVNRLEALLAKERTRNYQEEHVDKDASDEQLKAAHTRQTAALVALTRELKQSQDECVGLRSRIDSLEAMIQRQQQELSDAHGIIDSLNERLTAADASQKPETVESPTKLASPRKSELDKRILTELQTTKEQIRKYEARLSQRFKRGEEDADVQASSPRPTSATRSAQRPSTSSSAAYETPSQPVADVSSSDTSEASRVTLETGHSSDDVMMNPVLGISPIQPQPLLTQTEGDSALLDTILKLNQPK